MQLCFLSDPVGQYRISDRGVFDEGEGKGKGHHLYDCIQIHVLNRVLLIWLRLNYKGKAQIPH